MRAPVRTTAALLGISLVGAAGAVAAPRLHRTELPPPLPLPSSLAVDEGEFSVVPSKRVVAAGDVTMRVYNRGMDDHDLSLVDATGTGRTVYLEPGDSGTVTASLTPGLWKLSCSLFAGTPSSHEDLGMVAYLRAKKDPSLTGESARSKRR